ncbi:hypothetical protein SAMN05444162_0148 [Paenibacillaceae bacterium GAS479]|nr:hypothetical protein SAMN05444162_0148 [Paenibacillaceae bacterium GAS479]
MQITGWVWQQMTKPEKRFLLLIAMNRTQQQWAMRKALLGPHLNRAK